MSDPYNYTILLYGFPKRSDNPSASGFCQKLETFLRYTQTNYTHQATMSDTGPKKKLPYIVLVEDKAAADSRSEPISDSHFIIQHLISQNTSPDPDSNLSPTQKADSRAWQGYIEETLYTAIVCDRWFDDDNFAMMQQEGIFDSAPWLIRPAIVWYVRRSLQNTLWYNGMGRHSIPEIRRIITEAIEALSTKYTASTSGNVEWFHGGKEPSRIDLVVYGFLANSLGTKTNPHASNLMLKSPGLVAMALKLTKMIFPEYVQLTKDLEDAMKKLEGDR